VSGVIEDTTNHRTNYPSPIERFLRKMPIPPDWTCGLIFLLICTSFSAIAIFAGDFDIYATGIKTIVYSSSIAVLMYGEYWISRNIRRSLDNICQVFKLPVSLKNEILQKVHSSYTRLVSGTIVSVLIILVFFYSGPQHSFLPLIIYNYIIGAVLGFLMGEMIPGVKSLIESAIIIGKKLESEIDIIDVEKLDALEDLAGWGLYISVFGGFIAIVGLVGILYAPWPGAILQPSVVAAAALVITSVFILWAFIKPTLGIHQMMHRAKKEMRGEISRMHQSLYIKLITLHKEDMLFEDNDQIKSLSNLAETIEKLEIKVEQAPEWPFDVKQVQKVVGTSLLPIFIVILQNISVILSALGIG